VSVAQDELSRGFENMRTSREISAWYVFANRILVYIQEVLGDDIDRGWNELMEKCCTFHEQVNVREKNGVVDYDGERFSPQVEPKLREVAFFLSDCETNHLHEFKLLGKLVVSQVKDETLQPRPAWMISTDEVRLATNKTVSGS
jgi:hypothetical protein